MKTIHFLLSAGIRRNLMLVDTIGLLILLLAITANKSYAQYRVATGILIDTVTREPVSYAHLQIKGTNRGTVANSEGRFSLSVKEQLTSDTLVISSIGYASLTLAVNQLSENDTLFLREANVTLNPIIVTPLSAKEIVRKSIQSIPVNYPHRAYQLQGFYLTATQECQKYVRLLEGPVGVSDPGYTSKNSSDVTYFDTKQSKDYRKYRLEENNLLEDALTFEHVRLKSSFLNPRNLDDWTYKIAGYTTYNGRALYIISATYLADKNKLNHSANVYVGEDNLAIHKVEYQYHWQEQHFRQTSIDSLIEAEYQWEGEFHYADYGGNFYLKYFVFHHTKSIHDYMSKRKVCDIEVYSEFSTQEVRLAKEGLHTDRIERIKIAQTKLHKDILEELDSMSYARKATPPE